MLQTNIRSEPLSRLPTVFLTCSLFSPGRSTLHHPLAARSRFVLWPCPPSSTLLLQLGARARSASHSGAGLARLFILANCQTRAQAGLSQLSTGPLDAAKIFPVSSIAIPPPRLSTFLSLCQVLVSLYAVAEGLFPFHFSRSFHTFELLILQPFKSHSPSRDAKFIVAICLALIFSDQSRYPIGDPEQIRPCVDPTISEDHFQERERIPFGMITSSRVQQKSVSTSSTVSGDCFHSRS